MLLLEPNMVCRLVDKTEKLVCVRKLTAGKAVVHWKGYPDGAMWVVDAAGLEAQQGGEWVRCEVPADPPRGTKRKVRFDLGESRKRVKT